MVQWLSTFLPYTRPLISATAPQNYTTKQARIPRDGQRAQASIPRDGQKADHLELTNFMENILLFLKSQKSSF